MNTIAVGPFDEVESCVTGGTTNAIDRRWAFRCKMHAFFEEVVDVAASFNLDGEDIGFVICDITVREAISELAVGCIDLLESRTQGNVCGVEWRIIDICIYQLAANPCHNYELTLRVIVCLESGALASS